jgi:CspA family cold shock protein
MKTGIIKFFNPGKGFGFVTPDGGGADIFLPATTVTAAGATAIKPGQRVKFKDAPDAKGPKIISLELLGQAPGNTPVSAERVMIYCDSSTDLAGEVVEAVRSSGIALFTHDYTAEPLTADQLKRLSQMLSNSGQSLVRRYDPLFLELHLDDRFITDQDFWTAIVEHPSLINGPVVVFAGKARVCKAPGEVRSFLNKGELVVTPKPKTLSPRIAAMLKGENSSASAQAVETKSRAPEPATVNHSAAERPAPVKPSKLPKSSKPPTKPKPAQAAKKKVVGKKDAGPKKIKKRGRK